ncbi:hypothetical protein EON81_03680 [bacterium]|nr:MAG: hypothetical protein EON81_03680 [bacterium]
MNCLRWLTLGVLASSPIFAGAQSTWKPLWSFPAFSQASEPDDPIAFDGTRYLAIRLSDRTLIARDLSNGSVRWTAALPGDGHVLPRIAVDGTLVAIRRGMTLEARRLSDGALTGTIAMTGNEVDGLAIVGNRIHVGNRVLTWPEGQPTFDWSIKPEAGYNGEVSPNGRYYGRGGSYTRVDTATTRALKGRQGRFSPDSTRIYSFSFPDGTYVRGAIHAQNVANGSLLWTFVPPVGVSLSSAMPVGGDKVLALARQYDAASGTFGSALLYVLNATTGALVSTTIDPNHTAADLGLPSRIVASHPGSNQALIVTRADHTPVLRSVEVSAAGGLTVSPVLQYAGGTVDFSANRPVIHGPADPANRLSLGTMYQTDGTVAWRAWMQPRPLWNWELDTPRTGTVISRDGRLAASPTVDGFARTFSGISGSAFAQSSLTDGIVNQALPLFGGGAIVSRQRTSTTTEARLYQRVGSALKLVRTFTGAESMVPIATDSEGKRFVLADTHNETLYVYQADGTRLHYLPGNIYPTGPLGTLGGSRVVLTDTTLTTLATKVEPERGSAILTAMQWSLGSDPTPLRKVTDYHSWNEKDRTPIVADITSDARLMLSQAVFRPGNLGAPYTLIRMADGREVAHFSPTAFYSPAVDMALSQDAGKALLSLADGSHYYMQLPSIVESVEWVKKTSRYAEVKVRLMAPAPVGGTPIQWSINARYGTLPSGARIPAGKLEATFRMTLKPVSAPASAPFQASATQNDWIARTYYVTPPVPSELTLNPSRIEGGKPVALTIKLDGPAGPEGRTVRLSSSRSYVKPPATYFFPAGAETGTVTIPTTAITSDGVAILDVEGKTTLLSVLKKLTVAVTPNTATIKGGRSITMTITLNRPAPEGGLVALLKDGSTATDLPASVTIPAGSRVATFVVTSTPVTANKTVAIQASVDGKTGGARLTVTP